MPSYTTDILLDSMKVRGSVSSTGGKFTPERLLQILWEEFLDFIVPMMLKTRESYFAWDYDQAVNATGKYRVHSRAVGGKLDNVALIDAPITPSQRQDLTILTENELDSYTEPPGGKPGIYWKGNCFYLVPQTSHGWGYIRQSFFIRPGKFVETTAGAQISAINTLTKTVTFDTVPDDWTTGDTFDFIQDQPPFDTLDISKAAGTVTTGASGSIVFTDSLPDDLAVGDWVCLAGETCVVQAPVEFHPLLAQRGANICLASQTDTEALKNGESILKRLETGALNLITPRVEREGKKLVNRTGLLRRS